MRHRTFSLFWLGALGWKTAAVQYPSDLNPGPMVEWSAKVGGNSHQYQAVEAPTGITWDSAQAWAVAHGGYLATLHSPAENSFVYGLVSEPKYWINNAAGDRTLGPWLGGIHNPTAPMNQGWQWVNHEGGFGYTNWMPTQPGDGGDVRLQFLAPQTGTRQATWNDVEPSRMVHGFVAEFTPDMETPVTSTYVSPEAAIANGPGFSAGGGGGASSTPLVPPAPAVVPLPPGSLAGSRLEWTVSAGGNGHLYQAIAVPAGINWDDADSFAKSRGGYLATIGSPAENEFVFALVNDPKFWRPSYQGIPMGPWLGGLKTPTAGWQWENGEGSFGFTHWADREPDNDDGHQDRLHFYSWRSGARESVWDDEARTTLVSGFVIEFTSSSTPPVSQAELARATRQILWPMIAATLLAALIFFAGILLYLFRRPPEVEGDNPPEDS